MRDKRQKPGPKDRHARARANSDGDESGRPLVTLDDRIITKQGDSRMLALPKQGLSNLNLDSGDQLQCALDVDRGELVLRPAEEGE
jgi:hypothetical protein